MTAQEEETVAKRCHKTLVSRKIQKVQVCSLTEGLEANFTNNSLVVTLIHTPAAVTPFYSLTNIRAQKSAFRFYNLKHDAG